MERKLTVAALAGIGFVPPPGHAWTADREGKAEETKDRDLPAIKILATGGTIAGAQSGQSAYGYKSGTFKVEDLIKAVPNLDKLADLSGEQVANIGSQDMNDAVWLKLAKRVNAVLAERRGRRRGHHPRHRHHGGDRLLPEPGGQERKAGGAGGVDAAGHRGQRRRPGQPVQRRGRRRRPRRPGPRRAGGAQRRDPRGPQRHQDRHHQRRDLPQPQPRRRRAGPHRQDRLVRADGQAPHHASRSSRSRTGTACRASTSSTPTPT